MRTMFGALMLAAALMACGTEEKKVSKEEKGPAPAVPKECESYCDKVCNNGYEIDTYALGTKIIVVCECLDADDEANQPK